MKDLTEWLQRPQIGAKGLVYVKYQEDGSIKSTVGKFYSDEELKQWAEKFGAEKGDVIFVLSGEAEKTRKQLNELRLELGKSWDLSKLAISNHCGY